MTDVRIVNLANYTTPKVKEDRSKEWVRYGDDNNYYEYLIDRYNGSPTNNAIINGLSEMIYGQGLDATDSSRKPDEYAKMKTLFTKDCVRKLVLDLKLMGQCAMQVIYSKDRKSVAQVEHFPIETLRMEKAKDGEIEAYYYHPEWKKIKPSEKPERIPAFGKSSAPIEILCVKPYRAGFYYYSPVDYQGGLQYAELEEEIANYHLNNIKNGLAPSMLINFNNGIPNEEERELIEHRIYEKFSGSSNSGKFILSFNDNTETQANIEPVQLSDAHSQYEFLSSEASKKVLVSHRIVSPMLFGIKDQTGLGNNAEELKTASILTDNVVVKPFQNLLIDAFDQILAFNNINLNLYFKTLQPLEFTDLENVEDSETREEETGVKMASQKVSKEVAIINDRLAYSTKEKALEIAKDLGCEGFHTHEYEDQLWYMPCEKHKIDAAADDLIALGESQEDFDEWELVDEMDVDYDMEEKLDKMIGLASTGSARPRSKSEQDKNIDGVQFKVRYEYGPQSTSANSREFCKKMVAANKLYRKEDIIAMGEKVVNAGWGPKGADTYSIWKFKGGGNCHHKWVRKTFRFTGLPKGQGDVTSAKADTISTNKAEKEGYRVRNPKEVAMKPKDMKNQGFLKPRK
tara:strand:- start:1634 stop:3520 length:1887 start_codon:yes stop_codon:yes gene_type:complete